jgi:chromosome partitioning protein
MRTVAVTINKGGQGKTTLTRSLATAAALTGTNVLVLDMDTQKNSTSWGKRRSNQHQKPLPLVRFATELDLNEELERAKDAGCDFVIIDTPPGRNSEAPAAVECADLALIPFWNDQDSYDGVLITAGLSRRLGTLAFGVLNFATPNSRVHEQEARAVLERIPLRMVPIVWHRYDVHRLSNIKGLTAQEMEPGSIAAHEISLLWEWLRAFLQIGTSADVHKPTEAA